MTGKRFKIFEHSGDDYLLDMEYALGYDDPNVDYIEFLGQAMTTKECCKELNHLHEENEQLKIDKKNLYINDSKIRVELYELKEENEQLKERNNRQAKRLAELYELMAKKDWEALTEIIDDFCSCEEQLQREWRTYE